MSVAGGKALAHHALEIAFAFDNGAKVQVMSGGGELGAKMSEAWIAFARNGDPNTEHLPEWPAYEMRDRSTMILDNECEVVNDPDAELRRLWATIQQGAESRL